MSILGGFPFPAGQSQIRVVDPDTGEDSQLIGGLTSAVDVLSLQENGVTVAYLTLEYSLSFLTGGPGRLQLFTPFGDIVLDDELPGAGSMVYDRKSNSVIVASINTGELTLIPLP